MTRTLLATAILLSSTFVALSATDENRTDFSNLALANDNGITLVLDGTGNALQLDQSAPQIGRSANLIDLDISGDNNGGPTGSEFTALAAGLGLSPGYLSQLGSDNQMSLAVTGSGNLFAGLQSGTGNRLTAAIQGDNNQLAVQQMGRHNHASVFQSGSGNSISISQRSF